MIPSSTGEARSVLFFLCISVVERKIDRIVRNFMSVIQSENDSVTLP